MFIVWFIQSATVLCCQSATMGSPTPLAGVILESAFARADRKPMMYFIILFLLAVLNVVKMQGDQVSRGFCHRDLSGGCPVLTFWAFSFEEVTMSERCSS